MSGATAEQRQSAERRFEEALRSGGARDPRDYYRQRLRELKERDAEGFAAALAYYEETLIPAVAAASSDPLGEWGEYGRRLAELTSPGRTVQVDASGRALPYASPAPADVLVLHLPDAPTERALLVSLPRSLSPAQRATYDLLVGGTPVEGAT